MKRITACLLALVLLAQAAVVSADSHEQESTLSQVGVGTGSVVSSVVYFPVKGVLCAMGGLGTIYTSLFVGPRATHNLISTACRGTWAISPSVIQGEESVRFMGDVPPYEDEAPPPEKW